VLEAIPQEAGEQYEWANKTLFETRMALVEPEPLPKDKRIEHLEAQFKDAVQGNLYEVVGVMA